ncbi:hypothetical protein C9374_000523 [Naegleria lovaniensis]|uniref:Peroxisomal leader peptide-processing protease n=1 Tax=Naegleria lovaniensis TaxID=51637 RepID=A0AA88KNT2_NAELO|nr:uncharacterized protein C9374_000523 [Naegleria lovaniensis]KAG2388359.1 hypothetical protein C9374_000523 [Naegleria lovaniensis]
MQGGVFSFGTFNQGHPVSESLLHHDTGTLPDNTTSRSHTKLFGDSVMVTVTGQNTLQANEFQLPFFLNDMTGTGDDLSCSSSGFIVSSENDSSCYLITSGTIIVPFVQRTKQSSSNQPQQQIEEDVNNISFQNPNLKCKITLTLPNGEMIFSEILPSHVKRFGKTKNIINHQQTSSHTFTKVDIQFCGLYSHTVTDKYIYQMTSQLHGWYWGHPLVKSNNKIVQASHSFFAEPHSHFDDKSMPSDFISNSFLKVSPSTIAIFKISNGEVVKKYSVDLPHRNSNFANFLNQGEELYVVSSPFGLLSPHSLSNHLSKGIISNKINNSSNKQNLAILTDCQIHPGCEGAPVFSKVLSQTKCIGFCTLPIRSLASSTGLNIIISIEPFLNLFVEKFIGGKKSTMNTNLLATENQETSNVYHTVRNNIVLILINNTWASGILISQNGYILTNSHVMAPYMQQKGDACYLPEHFSIVVQLDVDLRDNEKNHQFHKAELVLFCNTGPLDVALLKIHDTCASHWIHSNFDETGFIKLEENVMEGDEVFVVGYPLMQPINTSRSVKQCTITKGIVSKVVTLGSKKAMICTTALVHDGNSGGGVFNKNGSLIGLVTSNIKYKLTDQMSDYEVIQRLETRIGSPFQYSKCSA